ncbi:MAG: hypothetical protein KGL39_55975 [Patescibacteria group bacterium]|nr:hypothetical protein [Patescibacteria group bacterium]
MIPRKTPKPDARRVVSEEDFERWCDDPTTRAVVASLMEFAEKQRDAWMNASWEAGSTDAVSLARLRGVAEGARILGEWSWREHASELAADRRPWFDFLQAVLKAEHEKEKA